MAQKNRKNSQSNKRKEISMSARERMVKEREEAARARANQNRLLIASAAFLAIVIAGFVYLGTRTIAGVAGELTFDSMGNSHIPYGQRSPVAYNSMPPNSGPHYGNLAAWDIHEDPIRYELLIHNMEDGGVIVYYQCEEDCPELVEQLTESVSPYVDGGRHVVMAPNRPDWTAGGGQPLHEDMGAKIVLTAWTKVLKLDEYDAEQIESFIRRYEGIDHHARVAVGG